VTVPAARVPRRRVTAGWIGTGIDAAAVGLLPERPDVDVTALQSLREDDAEPSPTSRAQQRSFHPGPAAPDDATAVEVDTTMPVDGPAPALAANFGLPRVEGGSTPPGAAG